MAINENVEIIITGKFENGQLVLNTVNNLDKSLKNVSNQAKDTDKNTSSLVSTLKKLAAIVGITAIANQFKNLVKGSLQAAGAMEQVNIALTTMLGSGDKAKKLQKDLIDFAKKTPFEIEGIFSSTKQLLAYGVAQEDIIDTMSTLGNIAAGVGVDMNRLALAFGQVKTTGRLMGQDLNQFTQAGVPLLAALANVLGKTEAEVLKLKESGQISFEAVKAALESLTSQGGRFYNLMENQSKTFLGTVSNMADSFYQVRVALGDALMPVAKRVVDSMIVWFGELKTIIENNKDSIQKFANGVVVGFSYIGKALKIAWSIIMNFFDGLKLVLSIPFVKETLAAAAAVIIFSKGLTAATIALRFLVTTSLGWIGIIMAVVTALGYLSKGIENMPDPLKIMALQAFKVFEQIKQTVFEFVKDVLDKLSVLSELPLFGWIDDAKKKFESLKDSAISNISAANDEIANLKAKGNVDLTTSELATPEIAAAQMPVQQNLLAPEDPAETEKKRLKALQEENEQLLQAQEDFLAGYLANQSEADKISAENKTLKLQQDLLKDEEYATQKQELDQALLDNKISLDEYEQELRVMNDEAKLEALQMQYDAELEKFIENQTLFDETKNEMQLVQDEAELMQLEMKQQRQEALVAQNNSRLVALKVQLEDQKRKQEKKTSDFQKLMDNEHLKNANKAAGELVALQNSKHKELAAIGKAAAIFQITNDTARGAMSAYASLAPIPIVGPVLGAVAAAAVIAYGAERVAGVKSNSFAVGTPNIPEDQMAMVHQGEMIVPATFSEAIRSGELSLSAADASDNKGVDATITNININFEGANFVGSLDNEDVIELGEKLGQLINENLIPALPTRTA